MPDDKLSDDSEPPVLFSRLRHAVDEVLRAGRKLRLQIRGAEPLFAATILLTRFIPNSLFFVERRILYKIDLKKWLNVREKDSNIRRATPDDLELFSRFARKPSVLRSLIERHTRAYILEGGGKLMAYSWFEPDQTDDYDWLRFISPGDVWLIETEVAYEHRGQGMSPRLKRQAAQDYAREGYSGILSSIHTLNRKSIRTQIKTGAEVLAYIFVIRLLGQTFLWIGGFFYVGRWTSTRPLELTITSTDGVGGRSKPLS